MHYSTASVDEMQYFALRVALSIKNRTCCSILQDYVKIHETASNSEFSKFTVISLYFSVFKLDEMQHFALPLASYKKVEDVVQFCRTLHKYMKLKI